MGLWSICNDRNEKDLGWKRCLPLVPIQSSYAIFNEWCNAMNQHHREQISIDTCVLEPYKKSVAGTSKCNVDAKVIKLENLCKLVKVS